MRTRLTIWNSIVVALVLVLLGFAVYLSTSINLYRSVDDELVRRSGFMSANWQKMPDQLKGMPPLPFLSQSDRVSIDPKVLEMIEFEGSLARPRILRPDGIDKMFPSIPMSSKSGFHAALSGRTTFETIVSQGRRLRVLSIPLRKEGKVAAVGQQMATLTNADEQVVRLRNTLFTLLPVALIVTYVASIYLTHRALLPVREIAEAASKIEAENLKGRLMVQGNDDFARLASTFNSMLGRLDSSFEKLATAYETQRRFTADASHELKTPLTVIRTRVAVALRGAKDPDRYLEHFQAIGASATVMTTLVQDLLILAQSDEGRLTIRKEPVELFDILHEAASHAGLERAHIHVDEDLIVDGDRNLLLRVFVNLLDNANRHTPVDGEIRATGIRLNDRIRITVADSGEGIPAEHVHRVFERFHRVDSSRVRETGGTGLGLPIARSIVEAHGGNLNLISMVGIGTQVTVDLPAPNVPSSPIHLSQAS